MKSGMKFRKMMMAAATGMMILAGCGSSKEASKTDTAESGKEVLKVGVECAYPPFNWTQTEETTTTGKKAEPIYGTSQYAYGYDVAVAQEMAKALDMDLEVHKSEWASITQGLDAGDYDVVISGMGRTAKREQSYDFTDPYYYRTNCLVVKKGSGLEDVKGLSDLAGKNVTVTTQLGTGWVDLLDQIPDATLGANYETTSECFMAVNNGVADVVVVDEPTARAALATNPDLAIVTLDENDKFKNDEEMTNIGIAVRKGDEETLKKMTKGLEKIGLTSKEDMDKLMDEAFKDVPATSIGG